MDLLKKIAAVAVVLSLLLVCGCSGKGDVISVSLNDYVKITATGTDGSGVVEYTFDTEAFAEEYGDKIKPEKAIAKKYSADEIVDLLFKECVDAKLSKSQNVKNDEVITLEWDCDSEKASKRFNVELKFKDIRYTVKNLKAGITNFVGRNYTDLNSSAFSAYDDVQVEYAYDNTYSDGVIASQNEKTEDGKKILVLTISKGPKSGSSDSSLTYIRSGEEISSADLEKLDAMFRQHILDVNFDSDKEVIDEFRISDVWVQYSDDQEPRNRVYFVYLIKAHNTQESGYFVWYGGYENLQSSNGNLVYEPVKKKADGEFVYPDNYFEVTDKINGLNSDSNTGYWYYGILSSETLIQNEIYSARGYTLVSCSLNRDENGAYYCHSYPFSARW